ncbi:hypothetical protein ACJJIQ_22090 [Microbulbifer sp. ANSA003]|uniref:hypothetical protein n=1 Tax=Microbulbifer sp. ANSA003 TaxID=3243360 RepID=UPI0040426562
MNRSASPEGRALKATAAALQLLQRATAIRGELRLTSAAFKTRRGITELFRGSLRLWLLKDTVQLSDIFP